MTDIDRRSFLGRGATLAGGVVAFGGLSTFLVACGDDSSSTSAPGTTGAGASPTSAGAPSTTRATTKVDYQLSWLPTSEHCGTYIAIENGFFKQYGLDVTPLAGGPNVKVDANVVGGKALIGATGADNVATARKNGAPIKIFAARLQKSPFCIVSLTKSGIKTPADLVGKKIGVAQANQTPWKVLLRLNNIEESKVNVVPVQFDPSPVANGEVDGQMVFVINEAALLKSRGLDVSTFLFADYGYSIYGGAYFATEDTIKNKKDILVDFLRAERKGWEANIADPNLGAKLTTEKYGKDLGRDPKHEQAQSAALKEVMVTPNTTKSGLLTLDPADIAKNIETMKLVNIDIAASDLFTDEILKAL
jgi:ABC-type nitrate/sulfonate/bicarbonate transport system substrate-binding protein